MPRCNVVGKFAGPAAVALTLIDHHRCRAEACERRRSFRAGRDDARHRRETGNQFRAGA
jgi:hypothetical protein